MPKKKQTGYEYIRATVDADGSLTMEYRVRNAKVSGRMSHDEDVSNFSNGEIETLVRGLLDATNDPVAVEVNYD